MQRNLALTPVPGAAHTSMAQYRVGSHGLALRQIRVAPSRPSRTAVGQFSVQAIQQPYSGANQQPLMGFGNSPQQPLGQSQYAGSMPSQQPQQAQQGSQGQQQLALVPRRPAYPQQTVFLYTSQVTGKQVITRSSGKSLGVVGSFWVDANSRTVVSFDLEEKKTVGSTK